MKFLYASLLFIPLICTSVRADYTPGLTTEPCGNGTGYIVVGNNGKLYCRSRRNFNWWSAMSWCQGIGMDPISINEDCICSGEKCPIKACPNFYFSNNSGVAFSSSNISEDYKMFSITHMGEVTTTGNYGDPCWGKIALCRMP